MKTRPRVLRVETGLISTPQGVQDSPKDLLDYHLYSNVPRWWRKIEDLLRLDIYLALQAKFIEKQYDIIWAGSEKVGIPLSFMNIQKPLVVIVHHLESPIKAKLVRATGIAKRWAGIGYVSNESKEFLINDLGVDPDRLFQYESAKYLDKASVSDTRADGPLMSLGVAKRDYNTLISALAELEGYETKLFVSSKFGDQLASSIEMAIPDWVHFTGFVPEDELLKCYQHTRFVVVPLEETTHSGAGISVVLEAGAFGKAVIATNTGGMPTFVKNDETGILVPPYDVEALRNAIQKLWENPELAQQMGMAGRRYVESQFNPETVKADILAFLDKIYSSKRCLNTPG